MLCTVKLNCKFVKRNETRIAICIYRRERAYSKIRNLLRSSASDLQNHGLTSCLVVGQTDGLKDWTHNALTHAQSRKIQGGAEKKWNVYTLQKYFLNRSFIYIFGVPIKERTQLPVFTSNFAYNFRAPHLLSSDLRSKNYRCIVRRRHAYQVSRMASLDNV